MSRHIVEVLTLGGPVASMVAFAMLSYALWHKEIKRPKPRPWMKSAIRSFQAITVVFGLFALVLTGLELLDRHLARLHDQVVTDLTTQLEAAKADAQRALIASDAQCTQQKDFLKAEAKESKAEAKGLRDTLGAIAPKMVEIENAATSLDAQFKGVTWCQNPTRHLDIQNGPQNIGRIVGLAKSVKQSAEGSPKTAAAR